MTILRKKSFILILASQCVSNTGEACRFVAITLYLVNSTGSGVSTAYGLICAALPGLLLAPFAGAVGDILPEKPFLAAADFFRAVIVLLFLCFGNLSAIYLLLVVFSIIDTLGGPPRRKLIAAIAGKKYMLGANSLLTGASGAAFLVGPAIGGLLADRWGLGPAFGVNLITYLASAILILMIHEPGLPAKTPGKVFRSCLNIFGEIRSGYCHFRSSPMIRKAVYTLALLGFGMVSLNMAFYPYAFDRLAVTARGWSLMITIFYGTNLVAMAITPLIPWNERKNPYTAIYILMIFIAGVWALYSITSHLAPVLLLQFTEGTLLALCGIQLGTLLQNLPRREFIARISGVNDFVGSCARLAALLFALVMLKLADYRLVFLIDSFLLLGFAAAGLISDRRIRIKRAAQKLFL